MRYRLDVPVLIAVALLVPKVAHAQPVAAEEVLGRSKGPAVASVAERICAVTCSATVPSAAAPGTSVAFAATAEASGCSGAVAFDWDFGDGSPHSTMASVLHEYDTPGIYDWTLTASADGVPCSQTGHILIGSGCDLQCQASAQPVSGPGPLEVAFTSTAGMPPGCLDPVSFEWDFGDGTSSNRQNTSHTYVVWGTYTWKLTAKTQDQVCSRTGSVTVVAPPLVDKMVKESSPFRIAVKGHNFQTGIRVYVEGSEWTNVDYKSEAKFVLKGGDALKALIPKGELRDFKFVNPDGGYATATWSW